MKLDPCSFLIWERKKVVDISPKGAQMVMVYAPEFDLGLVRRFVRKKYVPSFPIDFATNIDPRFLRAQKPVDLISFEAQDLSDVADEIGKMGYERVCFLLLTADATYIIYQMYSAHIADGVAMD